MDKLKSIVCALSTTFKWLVYFYGVLFAFIFIIFFAFDIQHEDLNMSASFYSMLGFILLAHFQYKYIHGKLSKKS